MTPERRSPDAPDHAALRAGLTAAQASAIATLELFGWTLRFVRRPLFRDPVPVLFDKDGTRWIVVDGDGALDENPDFEIRE
ncbi:hypothetical protein [Luteimonas terrae]|uniref:Uncharacterized protein n=1 Tax=Luteimonas terrae TaxID=1530191 RepID=A0A4V6PLU1_9GAMM|nr:hypothetical protein [Luteimonas terrae]TDK30634.1 hypothetical protein E2F49_09710 [Luteimonas terrae]